jgi:hypothetical protein
MTEQAAEKPEYEEWLHWAKALIARLATCVQIYSKPCPEGLMPEKTRQQRNALAIDLLNRLETLTDESDAPSDSLNELDHHGERVIDGLGLLIGEALQKLPEISADMQQLLKASWRDRFSNRLAQELFHGPMGNQPEGIGSGFPEDGHLPAVLRALLDRENAGDGRILRDMLPGTPRRQDGISRRWGERNSRILRSAGRVE